MTKSVFTTIRGYFRAANQWFLKTPERALDDAYDAVLMIRGIEDAHFGGSKISPDFGNYSQSVQAYFQTELKKYLKIAKVRLAEFKASSSALGFSTQRITEIQLRDSPVESSDISIVNQPGLVLKKLRMIDEVLNRYSAAKATSPTLITLSDSANLSRTAMSADNSNNSSNSRNSRLSRENDRPSPSKPAKSDLIADAESFADKTGVLPRSILRTVDRIKRELDPKAEEEVVENFRDSKSRTIISLRFILLLIIIPLLTQQVSKNFMVGPLVDHFRSDSDAGVFLNLEMEEEALDELQRFEERFRFEILIGKTPPVSETEIIDRVREKAGEIEEEYRQQSSNAIKNVFSDLFSLAAFAAVIFFSKREISILKTFLDELVYGLSDSAKAFIIILFTDTFVGFHSPHGWEVLLEGVSRHLGLPANRDFIFLFIATFPVILDTVFKYWIFRYLNRISPSAVATYKNMNE